jgi:hydroxymethylglutaryl-CoA lyase
MGIETGVDLARLVRVAGCLPGLVGHDVDSHLLKAGPSSRRYAMPPG